MTTYRCRCGETWTALGAAHCANCHRTFAASGLFDKHRSARGERGECIDPTDVVHGKTGYRLMFFRDGLWRGPELTEDQKLARFGAA